MARKRYTKQQDTPEVQRLREKRKWQISLRRYVLEQLPCAAYAPYFGLDIKNMRSWFEYQFKEGITWENFGEQWQFDHVVPVAYFDFSNEEELKMCWNFTNIRVEAIQLNKDKGGRLDVLAAKNFFRELYSSTKYAPCLNLLNKIDQIELSEQVSAEAQQAFIHDHREYLEQIEGFSHFEFELLNRGRSVEEVKKEIAFLKNI